MYCHLVAVTRRKRLVATLSLVLGITVVQPAGGIERENTALYGGLFDSTSTIAYAEVVQVCFGGLGVGTCQVSSPEWLQDYLENEGNTGAFCASCCSSTDKSDDNWTFDCPLNSAAFAEFVNKFGWEFRFARRETLSDKEVVTCHIPRTACSYDEDGSISGTCESDGSFLASYVISLEVMNVEKGLTSWKSVQSCSVVAAESDEQPASVRETLLMTQVYADGSAIEPGWSAFIALAAFLFVSCFVRFARDDTCIICGHHLIWFRKVCSPCRFYGYDAPSKDVMEIIKDKRSVVLPEPTLDERLRTVKASTAKVFVQATETLLLTKTYANSRLAREYTPHTGTGPESASDVRMERAKSGSTIRGGDTNGHGNSSGSSSKGFGLAGWRLGHASQRPSNHEWIGDIKSARSVTFVDDIHGSPVESSKTSTATRKGKVACVMIPLQEVVAGGDLADEDSTARKPAVLRRT